MFNTIVYSSDVAFSLCRAYCTSKVVKLGKSDQLRDKHQQDETRQISNPSQKHEINQFNVAQERAVSLMLENTLQCYYRRGKEVGWSLLR